MKQNASHTTKRILSLVLCLSMVIPGLMAPASAETEPQGTGGLCAHHPAHDAQCGYVEAVEGHPCEHVHNEACGYAPPTEEVPCSHIHDEACGYQEALAEVPCDMDCTDVDGDGVIDHQAGCAYQPGTGGHACSHVHDAACGYQAASEGRECTHVHDEACGYAEAVEGQPCTFVCQECEGETVPTAVEGADAQSLDYIITTPLPAVGSAGTSFDLLSGVTVAPDTYEDGSKIQVRIKTVESTDSSFHWDGTASLTPQISGVTYTVTYEAYVTVEGAELVLAEMPVSLQIMGTEEIGERLDGDYAYLAEARLMQDDATQCGWAVRTGSAPWDEEEGDGNDTTDLDNTVRSFDIITYTAYFRSKMREDAPCKAYRTGTLHFEFILQGNETQACFDTGAMGWLTAKKEAQYTITDSLYQGKPCQVLRGSYLWEPNAENPAAIGESAQTLTLAVRALAMKKGDILDPKFTFWLDCNDVPETGLVTDSGCVCETHGDPEYVTISGPEIQVTTAPRYNVRVVNGHASLNQGLGTFDFSTGNDLAANKDAGIKEGRIQAFGAVIQIVGKPLSMGCGAVKCRTAAPLPLICP